MGKMAERFVPNAGRDAMHCVCTPAQAYKCAELVSRMCGTGVQNVQNGRLSGLRLFVNEKLNRWRPAVKTVPHRVCP